ncbi:hypothetical protein HMPREF0758_0779 [Serratia odorifera DSM 4582]|uniref:Uncharacterized protein n=1 Tax=Serratia odorifera DSM 4582 TaxID=667129 RepID=D4DXZ6_SEROD|nr:hypothetical protein HMPREF0758_0779 [Serratia odorifera DSM 4582]
MRLKIKNNKQKTSVIYSDDIPRDLRSLLPLLSSVIAFMPFIGLCAVSIYSHTE